MRLGTASVSVPSSEWVIRLGAHEGIVDTKTFALAQKILANLTVRKTDEELLEGLRSLLATKGKISNKIINESAGMPRARTFWYRFGGVRRACELIGYDWSKSAPSV